MAQKGKDTMASFDVKKLQKDITALNKEFADAFHETAERSRRKAMEGLRPGDPVPPTGKIYGEADRQKFEAKAADIRSRGYALINKAKADLERQIAEAPKPDAVNAVAMLSHRTHVTRQEVDTLLQVYGDNYQTYQAIRDIAGKNEIFIEPSNLEKGFSAIAGESSAVGSFTLKDAENGNVASDSKIAFRDWLTNIT